VDEAPAGDGGYRMHARIDGGQVKLLTRTGLDRYLGSTPTYRIKGTMANRRYVLIPKYPRTKSTITIAPTHQIMLFIVCS
jgi:hypothetical protein